MEGALSPTRTKSTWKPRVEEGDLGFLPYDGGVALWLGDRAACLKKDNWRSPIFSLPCCDALPVLADQEDEGTNGEGFAEPIEPRRLEKAPVDSPAQLRYRLTGGFDSAALEVYWETGEGTAVPQWVALKSYTGIQVKYPTPGKRPPLVFALADEDAYCYCDLDPCQECVANCKRGFILYAYYGEGDLVQLFVGR